MAPLLAQKIGVDRNFERLYRRYAVDVYRYAYAVLRNQADAEDVAQTTFMNAYRALERGETPQAPHNWLIAIAHNVCRQRFRQQSRRVQEVGLDIDVAETLVGVEDDDTPTPEDIKRALGHLAFNQRAALVMRELEGRSYAEIADLLNLSIGAVETLIFRARRALREQLEASITCGQAEQFLSRRLDSELARAERSQLRAHLRECADCRRTARSQRAQRSALKALGAVPLPSSLASLFGGGGGAAVTAKVAAVVVATTVAGGIGYDAHRKLAPSKQPVPTPATQPAATAQPARAGSTARQLPETPVAAAAVAKQGGHARRHAKKHAAARPVATAPVVEQSPAEQPATEHGRSDRGVRPEQRGRPERGARTQSHAVPTAKPHAQKHDPPAPRPAPPAQSHDRGRAADPGRPADESPAADTSGKKADLLPLPQLSPLPAVPDLTQTSQTGGARNGDEWHLHQ